MIDRYLPVPVWDNRVGQWEPIDFLHGQHVTARPDRFELTQLPLPDYRNENRVQFVREETRAREGVVRMVLLRGGAYGPLDQVEELIQQWYCNPVSIVYIVAARGHDHTIRPWNMLGLFGSPNRWER
jgi:hypothetical protein